MSTKITVAVFFGGLSPEHDVSVLTGLEAAQALNPALYEALPVYVDLQHQWWVGPALLSLKNYLPDAATKQILTRVALSVGNERHLGQPVLREVGAPFWRQPKTFPFHVALPAFHGSYGEDGTFQGVLHACGVPFIGGGVTAMGLTIDKFLIQQVAAGLGLPTVPTLQVHAVQPELTEATLTAQLGAAPWVVKPNRLGSSLGVRVVHSAADVATAVTAVLQLDTTALVQRCVPNLVEYNVAVRRLASGPQAGQVVTSAIERPLKTGTTLDFKDKYMSGGQGKLTGKLTGQAAGGLGMVSANRVYSPPELTEQQTANLRHWATQLFNGLNLAGAPRLDFMADSTTGEIWFNEINPIPGSLGYYLWENATPNLGYTALLSQLVEEALTRSKQHHTLDPLQTGGALFPKRG